ncbi:sugar ABC transporter permease [Haladaptatus sp. AB643]|uniref:carbohydrate ABC transporter permease n=2 Tax=unclassified Haladaptatus TaxID=2622732 RepID=UPI00209C4946|nr:sugar ABC transporter permease [Haladaptatus sp. AB643]MCO8243970.1 sugar ABC transporter permease [Haladaptatus sp. AB643]
MIEQLRDTYRKRTGNTDDLRTDGGTATERTSSRFDMGPDFLRSLPFWLPPFLVMGFFVYGAIAWNFLVSLTDYNSFVPPTYSHLDFEMYTRAFSDPTFLAATKNTFVLLVVFTVFCLLVGLGLAILIDQKIRFENTFRTIYLLPMSLSFVVTAQFWLWMYNYSDGPINVIIRGIGIQNPPHWISDPSIVLGSVVLALVWQFSGYAMVVYLAGLRAIPNDHFEAARVDGASTYRLYRRVVIPQLKGATISASVVLMVFGLKAFDFLYSLTGSYYPPKGSDILATMMVRQAFGSPNNTAYAAAIGIMLFLLALVVIAPYLTYQYKRGEL